MNKMKDKKIIIDFIKFSFVGIINTIVSYILINTFHYVLKIDVILSNLFTFLLSVLLSYILNSIFVFKLKDHSIKTILKSIIKAYLSYAFTGIILTSILLEIECNKIGIPLYIASLMNLIITVPLNFLMNRYWTFRNKINKTEKELNELSKIHTFAICAYKESPYLEECIKSILDQEIKTNVIISTSTPNKLIESLAKKYNIKLFIKKGKSNIREDWNNAYNNAKTELVTVAHQDDVYLPGYTKEILKAYSSDVLMYNTNYYPYKNGEKTTDLNNKLKPIIKFLTRFRTFARFKFIRVMTLAFGNTINCPSVTYNKKLLGNDIFTSDLLFSIDWDTFLKIYKMKGISLYIHKKLVCFRIHDGATTKEFINNKKRIEEDVTMFNKIWPKFITKIIMKVYVRSYDTYN